MNPMFQATIRTRLDHLDDELDKAVAQRNLAVLIAARGFVLRRGSVELKRMGQRLYFYYRVHETGRYASYYMAPARRKHSQLWQRTSIAWSEEAFEWLLAQGCLERAEGMNS